MIASGQFALMLFLWVVLSFWLSHFWSLLLNTSNDLADNAAEE